MIVTKKKLHAFEAKLYSLLSENPGATYEMSAHELWAIVAMATLYFNDENRTACNMIHSEVPGDGLDQEVGDL